VLAQPQGHQPVQSHAHELEQSRERELMLMM
jgi:hypothetical protein